MNPERSFLNKLSRQVKKGDTVGIGASLQSLPPPQRSEVGLKAARWSVGRAQAASLRECLNPSHGVDPNGFLDNRVPTLVHAVGEVHWDWKGTTEGLRSVVSALMAVLLEAHGGHLPSYKRVESPLVRAAQQDDLIYARALLEAGVDPDGEYRWQEGDQGGHGFTPLHCARSMAMVELLLSKGASLSAAPAGAELGGMAGVLMKWQHEADLPRLIERWVERGGRLDDPMESYRPAKMSLLSYVFQNVWEVKVSPASSDWHVWQARRERAHVIQNVLVGNGWVDLDQADTQGVSWRQWVERYGSAPLQKKLALEEAEPSPSKASRPRF